MRSLKLPLRPLSVAVAALLAGTAHAESYKYTGTLYSWGEPANGSHELRVSVFDAATKGQLVAPVTTFPTVSVENGTFEVELEIGDALSKHGELWIQTEVGPPGGALVALDKRELATNKAAGVCWGTAGNTGTDPAFDFLGTTDSQPFNIRVNNGPVARFDNVSADGASPNVIFGGPYNAIAGGVQGANIAGGGAGTTVVVGNLLLGDVNIPGVLGNKAYGSYGSVGGGLQNTAGHPDLPGAADDAFTVVAGGYKNQAIRRGAAVSGGQNNVAGTSGNGGGNFSAIAGGSSNQTGGDYSFVAGGQFNLASGDHSFAGGLQAQATFDGSFVWADSSQQTNFTSTADNQYLIRAKGGVGIGTQTPQNQLHIVGSPQSLNGTQTDDYVVQISNGQFSGAPGGLAVTMAGGDSASTNFLAFFSDAGGAAAPVGAIERNGANGVTFRTTGADYAEYLPKENPDETIAPGDVVAVRNGKVSRNTANAQILLVASTGAAISGNAPAEEDAKDHVLTAMLGQVDVRVRGRVAAGDMLVASPDSDGSAIAIPMAELSSTDAMRIVGRAWTSHEGEGQGRVRALIGHGRADEVLSTEVAALRHRQDESRSELARNALELQTLRDQVATLKQESAIIAGLVQQLQANTGQRLGAVSHTGAR